MKRLLSTALACALIAAAAAPVSAAGTIGVEIDGATVPSSVEPIVENGATLVPLRLIGETLGARVEWDAAKKQATLKTAAYTVAFTIGSKTYTVNGASKSLSVEPKIVGDRTLVPLRAFSEAIGASVSYDAAAYKASVKYFTEMSGSIKVSGSTTVLPIMQSAADKLSAMNNGLSIAVSGGGSGAGIKDSQNGVNNVGMSSRELTADELATLTPYQMANDAIAIIVNPKNSVKNLSKEQAKKIFLGEIKNWQDVGGANAPILVQTRETGSGTLSTLEEMLLDKEKVVDTATPFTSSALIKQAVAKSENAVGFDSVGFVDDSVRALSLDNITPSETTVKNASYPLSRSLFVLTKGAAGGINAKLIDYLRTQSVQNDIVKKEGYITLD
ncbi:MAG: phosphate ABC transporter substrate-binding protein PstS family protein [Clostridiales Family XIII bacterium]|jgi:phosphate transport system substrate-binding protein|nr:phosphate ABC transporter substrate-binding protein PstS family protein [Clostridiales Family XIII bacterium]